MKINLDYLGVIVAEVGFVDGLGDDFVFVHAAIILRFETFSFQNACLSDYVKFEIQIAFENLSDYVKILKTPSMLMCFSRNMNPNRVKMKMSNLKLFVYG